MIKNFFKIFSKRNRGISPMETVVYVSLVALISFLIVDSTLILQRTFKEIRSTREIGNSAISSLDRIMKEIRRADGVNLGSVFATTTSRLILEYSGASTSTIEFSLDQDRVMHLIENGVDGGTLTSSNLSVENFWVQEATTSNRIAFRITLAIKDKRISSSSPTLFYGAATMRGLY